MPVLDACAVNNGVVTAVGRMEFHKADGESVVVVGVDVSPEGEILCCGHGAHEPQCYCCELFHCIFCAKLMLIFHTEKKK